jgi:hypothetical protein
VYCRISTNSNRPSDFNIIAWTNKFLKASYPSQFAPWTNTVVNLGGLGIPAGTPIYFAIQEYEWDNTWNEAALELDVITSDLTPIRSVSALLSLPFPMNGCHRPTPLLLFSPQTTSAQVTL